MLQIEWHELLGNNSNQERHNFNELEHNRHEHTFAHVFGLQRGQ
jgi:hypothetical protein